MKVCCKKGGEEKQEELTARWRGLAFAVLLLHLDEQIAD